MPEGYRQTEVGVIPENWIVAPLLTVCSLKSGESITSANIDDIFEYPCFGGNGLRGFASRSTHSGEYALVGRQGALCGNVVGVKGDFFASEHAIVVTPFKKTNIDWLAYVLRRMNLNQYSESSAQPGLSVSKLLLFLLAVPDFKEQTAIAKALSDVDALITSLEKLIAKKRAIKTATMQQLLTGKTRLPPFDQTHTGYKQTELGEIPEDWEVKPISAALSIRHGKDQKQVEVQGGIYPILGTGGEMGRTDTFLYDKPSVLIGRKGTINRPVYMESPFWTVDTLFYSEVDKQYSAKFIYYKFCMIDWMAYNEASGVPSLNVSTIEKIIQSFPVSKEEQVAIESVLSNIDKEINALELRLTKTQQLKQGMMQELLTGRTRLV
jgi:type I restriction enzyme S subunit